MGCSSGDPTIMYYKRDFFRDTVFRYLGYANEIGEALRPKIGASNVHKSYGIAAAYVLADTADKGIRTLANTANPFKAVIAVGDCLIWQSLASIIIPGYVINRIVFYSEKHLSPHYYRLPPKARPWATVAIGLAAIPIIVTPIDLAVHGLMNITYRPIFGRHYCESDSDQLTSIEGNSESSKKKE